MVFQRLTDWKVNAVIRTKTRHLTLMALEHTILHSGFDNAFQVIIFCKVKPQYMKILTIPTYVSR